MKVPIKCLKKFVDIDVDIETLANLLTMSGTRVKSYKKNETTTEDELIDVEINPHRPDCNSVLGIAREVSALLNKPIKEYKTNNDMTKSNPQKELHIIIEDEQACNRYSAAIIKNVKVGPSPKWLIKCLADVGIQTSNNISDIINYVIHELGQPICAYVLDEAETYDIYIRRSKDGEKVSVGGSVVNLNDDFLVISDKVKPISVAEISDTIKENESNSSVTIMLEAAAYNGFIIKTNAKCAKVYNEIIDRYVRGTDKEKTVEALEMAVSMIEEFNVGELASKIVDVYPGKSDNRVLKLRLDKINSIIGTDIKLPDMIDILKRLGLKVAEDMSITIPSYRNDIEVESDIAAEIARINGYENIKPVKLGEYYLKQKRNNQQRVEDKIRNLMVGLGISEIYTNSLIDPESLEKLNIPAESKLRAVTKLINPINKGRSILRTTTVPSIINVMSRNYTKNIKEAKLYEIASIYLNSSINDSVAPEQKKVLTIGMYGDIDFLKFKGYMEDLLDYVKADAYEYVLNEEPYIYQKGRASLIVSNNQRIGEYGLIDKEIVDRFKISENTYVGVIYLDVLLNNIKTNITYKPLQKYPVVTRKLSLLMSKEMINKSVMDVIYQNSSSLIKDIKLIDVYSGAQVPSNLKSMTYTITFAAEDRTLNNKEVDDIIQSILENLKEKHNILLR